MTVDGVEKGDKGRLEFKEKLAKLRSRSRSRIGREWHKEPARDGDCGYDIVNGSNSNVE